MWDFAVQAMEVAKDPNLAVSEGNSTTLSPGTGSAALRIDAFPCLQSYIDTSDPNSEASL